MHTPEINFSIIKFQLHMPKRAEQFVCFVQWAGVPLHTVPPNLGTEFAQHC
jgi:hypothetical protein